MLPSTGIFSSLLQTQIRSLRLPGVTGNQHRLAPLVRLDAFGTGSYALDFTDPLSPASLIHPGSNWNFQFWYRDPQTVGHGFNLSDALKAQFCP